jgi:hypothetical protein
VKPSRFHWRKDDQRPGIVAIAHNQVLSLSRFSRRAAGRCCKISTRTCRRQSVTARVLVAARRLVAKRHFPHQFSDSFRTATSKPQAIRPAARVLRSVAPKPEPSSCRWTLRKKGFGYQVPGIIRSAISVCTISVPAGAGPNRASYLISFSKIRIENYQAIRSKSPAPSRR